MSRHAIPVQQKRSQDSLDRMLAAAEIVLARDGWAAFTMNAVAQEADVSIGGIYRRFEGKEQLLRAIKERVLTRADGDQRAIVDSSEATDLSSAIEHYVIHRTRSLRNYSALMRQVFAGQDNDPVMEERGRKSINVGIRSFRSVLSPHRAEIMHRDPELAIEMAFYMMNATFIRRVRSPISDLSFDHIDWDVIETEILTMLTLYLKQGPAKAPTRSKARSIAAT